MLKRFVAISAISLTLPLLNGCVPLIIAGAGASAVGVQSAASNLSLGTQVTDLTIKNKANSIVNNIKSIKFKANVGIVVFNKIVLLLGEVPNAQAKHDIASKISYIPGVKVVYNQLKIGPKSSFKSYVHDSWITTEIKARMLSKVNAAHFKVVTNQGVVYLLGLTTPDEGAIAAHIASQVKGVKQVVKAYSYVEHTDHKATIDTP